MDVCQLAETAGEYRRSALNWPALVTRSKDQSGNIQHGLERLLRIAHFVTHGLDLVGADMEY
jgi:hypothetical protein